MKKLLLATALASVNFVTAAHAGSVTVNGITITQVGSHSPGTFDNNSANDGDYTGNSWAIYDGKVQPISFVAGADTTGVTNGTFGYAAAPDHETSNYLWGSIDAIADANRYDNILVLSNGDAITGSDLVDAGAALGNIDGSGAQTGYPDNQWFLISDRTSFSSFSVYSSQNAFEFDMATPEASTWAMMLLGFAGLGYAGFRRSAKSSVSIA